MFKNMTDKGNFAVFTLTVIHLVAVSFLDLSERG